MRAHSEIRDKLPAVQKIRTGGVTILIVEHAMQARRVAVAKFHEVTDRQIGAATAQRVVAACLSLQDGVSFGEVVSLCGVA